MSEYILVTGGAGYIGSHTCKELARKGYVPVAYDSLIRGHEWAVKWGPFERGDISDAGALRRVIESYQPMAVVHFAADAYVGESVNDPEKYYRNNVAGSLSLLSVLRQYRECPIVFSSSCAVYGCPSIAAIHEDTDLRPINPYGFTKFIVEQMLADFQKAYGTRSISLRYFNAVGADPTAEIGEDHTPETHLVPLALDVALGRRPHLNVFGTDYSTPDGTCVRDFVHVTDLATAHVLAVQRLVAGGDGGVFNLGTGNGASVMQVVEMVREVTKQEVPVQFGGRREGDPPVLTADARRACAVLGWKPERGSLRLQIEDAWRWHRKHFSALNSDDQELRA